MEQYFHQAAMNGEFNEDGASFEKLKSVSSTLDEPDANPSVGFECNICLDLVHDPVVTLCGHLYCWPCIYRWINFNDSSVETPDHQKPQCPVCKSEVSDKLLIPLYGRGEATNSPKDKLSHLIPQRPPSPRCGNNMIIPTATTNHPYPYQQQPHQQRYALPTGGYMAPPSLGHGGSPPPHLADPMIGMFGEMVYARIFGNSETALYAYPNSYRLSGSNTLRLRRHMMQTDRSLSRVFFFFCCCMILCLILF